MMTGSSLFSGPRLHKLRAEGGRKGLEPGDLPDAHLNQANTNVRLVCPSGERLKRGEAKLETVKLAANHRGCEFEVDAIMVGKLCVHLGPNEGVECRVSHAATLFAMPGSYLSRDDAMAAATEIDAMVDWDAIVPAISPIDASPEERMAYADLGNAVWEIACKHGSLPR